MVKMGVACDRHHPALIKNAITSHRIGGGTRKAVKPNAKGLRAFSP
jgi:hypothetical protein